MSVSLTDEEIGFLKQLAGAGKAGRTITGLTQAQIGHLAIGTIEIRQRAVPKP